MAITRERWKWVIFVAVFFGTTLADILVNISGVYLVAWKEYFNCSMAEVSVIAGITNLSYCLGGISGSWVNKIGYRTVVVFGGAVSALGVFLSTFVSTKSLLVVTFGVMYGFFAGTTYPGFNVAMATYFVKNFSTVRGVSCSGIALGLTVFPPLMQYMIDTYGWQGSLLIMSALVGNAVVCGLLLRPEESWKQERSSPMPRPTDAAMTDDRGDNSVTYVQISDQSVSEKMVRSKEDCMVEENGDVQSGAHNNLMVELNGGYPKAKEDQAYPEQSDVARLISLTLESRSSNPFIRLCRNTGISMLPISFRLSLFVFSQFMLGFCYVSLTNHIIASVVFAGINAQTASFLISFIGGGSFVGRIANGLLIDLGWMSARNVYMLAIVFCGVAVMLVRLAAEFWVAAMLCVVIGLGSGTIMSLQVVLSKMYVGTSHMGRALGIMLISYGIGGVIGPVLGGWMFDITKNYDCLFYTFGGVFSASGLLWLLEPKLERMETAKARRILAESDLNTEL